MRRREKGFGAALLLSVSLLGSSPAGTLGNFEDAVAKPGSRSDPDTLSGHEEPDLPDGSETAGKIGTGVMAGLIYGAYRGVKYVIYDWWAAPAEVTDDAGEMEDAPDRTAWDGDDSYPAEQDEPRHVAGTPGAPYIRFDYRWQYLDSDLDANDVLLEAGYRFAAFYGRYTRYEDRAANETLNIEQYYGMLRYGGTDEFFFPGSFQIGAGIGGYVIEGEDSQSGAALTIPVMLYPADWWGLEFRPAWASINDKTISDYDISVSAGARFLHLRAGYRWLWVQGDGDWLNGPYAGITLSF